MLRVACCVEGTVSAEPHLKSSRVVALSAVTFSVVMSLERLVVIITTTSLNVVDLFFLDGFSIAN